MGPSETVAAQGRAARRHRDVLPPCLGRAHRGAAAATATPIARVGHTPTGQRPSHGTLPDANITRVSATAAPKVPGMDAMVSITAHIPEDAMSAGLLGT